MSVPYDAQQEQQFYDGAKWGVFQSYHRAVLADLLAVIPEDAASILDVGCGDGLLTNELPLDRDVTGLDLSPEALKTVKRRAIQGSALDLPFAEKSIDLVMANDVIEHFAPEHRALALAEMERVASKYIIITTPFTERLASGFRTAGRGRTHVNRHFDSFDVETMKGLFRGFRMTNCIFSGDEWDDELAPINYLKRSEALLEGGRIPLPGAREALDVALADMRVRQATYLSANPAGVDALRRRTEIMAVYERREAHAGAAGRLDSRSRSWDAAVETARKRDCLEISAGDFRHFLSPILPLISRLPYVVTQAQFEDGSDHVTFEDEGLLDLKFGFYSKIEEGAVLEIRLDVERETSLSLNAYDPEESYVNLYRQTVALGHHLLQIKLGKPTVSAFGYLFQLVCENGPVRIASIRVEQQQRPSRLEASPGFDYVSRVVDGCTFYTGLEKTGRLLPLWFPEAEKLPPTPHDLFETSAETERYMLELALLRRPAGKKTDPIAKLAVIDQRVGELETIVRFVEPRMVVPDSFRRAEHASLMERIALLEQQVQDAAQTITVLRQSPMLRLGRALGMPMRLFNRVIRMGQKRKLSNRVPASSLQQGGLRKTDEGLPMRVTMLVPDDRIDRRVLLEARTIAARGAQVVVISVPYPDVVDLDQQQFPELKIVRIDTSKAASIERDLDTGRLKGMGFDWKHVYFYTYQFLEAALAQPADLIVAHDLPVLPAAVAAADMLGARLLYDAHELYPEQLHFGEERMELYRQVENALVSLPDTVITVNKSIAEEMARRYKVNEPMVVLNAPNAAGMTVPVPRSTLLRQSFQIPESTRIMLFQGSLSLNRNLENLVEAMAYVQSQDVVLVVMGPGEAKRRELEGIALALGIIGTRVFFYDAVPQNELLDYTSGADFGIIPYPAVDINTTLCTPNKLFEFFVAGLPILANDLPELRRFVLGNGAGITHPMRSAFDIAAAIDRMARDDLSAYRKAVERAAASMTWQAQEPVVIAAYVSTMRG